MIIRMNPTKATTPASQLTIGIRSAPTTTPTRNRIKPSRKSLFCIMDFVPLGDSFLVALISVLTLRISFILSLRLSFFPFWKLMDVFVLLTVLVVAIAASYGVVKPEKKKRKVINKIFWIDIIYFLKTLLRIIRHKLQTYFIYGNI